jgi:TolA-binding protein
VRERRRGTWRLGLGAALLLLGCAHDTTPLLREDWEQLRADLLRLEQTLQQTRTDAGEADRRSAEALSEVQRGVTRLGVRLEDLGRQTAQLEGRLDQLRQRIDALALQYDVVGPPGSGGTGRGTSTPTPDPQGSAPSLASPPPLARAATDLYQTAYIDYTRGNYNLALAAFQEFVRLHPTAPLAEKAQYWIGECHFSLAKELRAKGEPERATPAFERAVQEFRRVADEYPRGDRVPAALYKEGLALLELGQASLAEARLQLVVDQFPSTEDAAKARDELARLKKP